MRPLAPYLPLIALTGVLSVVQAARVAGGTAASASASQATEICVGWMFFLWLLSDARRRGLAPCHEFGFLVGVFLPFSFFWYVFWTRGWRGFLLLAAFFGVVIVPEIVAAVSGRALPAGG